MPNPKETNAKETEPEKVLFSWSEKSRPFKRRTREFYITLVSIVSVVGLIIFLVEGPIPVILLITLVFLFYVLSTVEPENIEYKITNKGIKIAEKETFWEEILRYWFIDRLGSKILVFEKMTFPGRLELIVKEGDEEEIVKAIGDNVQEEKRPPTYLDKTTEWVSQKLPQS